MESRKYAIIRGGCSGLGREISLRLASEGYDIVGNFADVNQSYKGDALIADVEALGRKCVVHNGDLREYKQVQKLFQTAQEAFGDCLAVFVNNGGIFDGKRLPELEVWEYEELTAIHINAALHCTKEACRVMQGQGGGAIINVTAIASPPVGEVLNVSLERTLFDAFTRSLASTMEPYGVRFNSVLCAMVPSPGEEPPPPMVAPSGPGHDRMCGPFADKGDTDAVCDMIVSMINSPHMSGQIVAPNLRV